MSKTYNKEAKREYNKRYYLANREKLNRYQQEYRRRNPDKASKWSSYRSDPIKRRAQIKAWVAANPEKRIAAQRKSRGLPTPTRPEPKACECCGKPKSNRALHLDHCHTTGIFRGWLCNSCNLSIGKLGDTVDSVRKALDYLLRSYGMA